MVYIKTINSLAEATRALEALDVHPKGIEIMAPKMVHRVIKLEAVTARSANIIKQELLAAGGDAAMSRGALSGSRQTTDLLLMGTLKQYERLCYKLSLQPFGLSKTAERLRTVLQAYDRPCTKLELSSGHVLQFGHRTLIMGVLNVTPDSFYDGGRFFSVEHAVAHAKQMEKDGADIIDIGGESTRPGSEPVSVETELERVIPVIKKLKSQLNIPISIDTQKSKVAAQALAAGAEIVNDVSALRTDKKMVSVIAKNHVPIVLMHMKGTPKTMQQNPSYMDVVSEIFEFLRERAEFAVKKGVKNENIIVDPGIGFGKRTEDNIEIIRRLRTFKALGYPLLIGPSRKTFIGNILGLSDPADRLEGTLAAVSACIMNGADIVRVHDVRECVRVAKIIDTTARYCGSGSFK